MAGTSSIADFMRRTRGNDLSREQVTLAARRARQRRSCLGRAALPAAWSGSDRTATDVHRTAVSALYQLYYSTAVRSVWLATALRSLGTLGTHAAGCQYDSLESWYTPFKMRSVRTRYGRTVRTPQRGGYGMGGTVKG